MDYDRLILKYTGTDHINHILQVWESPIANTYHILYGLFWATSYGVEGVENDPLLFFWEVSMPW